MTGGERQKVLVTGGWGRGGGDRRVGRWVLGIGGCGGCW